MVWDGVVAVDLFFAGMGAWAFVFSVVLGWGNERCRKLKTYGMVAAFVAVALGALILAVDAKAGIQDPLRFFYLFTNFGSVMTWGVLFISAFLLVCLVCVILRLRKRNASAWLEIVGCVLALCVAAYTGVLLGSSDSYPLWNIAVLPLLFLASAAYTGLALVGLIGWFVDREDLAASSLPGKLCLILPVAVAVLLAALLAVASSAAGSAAAAGAQSVAGLLTGDHAVLFWLGAVVVGIVAPLALEAWGAASRRSGKSDVAWRLPVEFVCILLGGFVLRYLVVVAALPIAS